MQLDYIISPQVQVETCKDADVKEVCYIDLIIISSGIIILFFILPFWALDKNTHLAAMNKSKEELD